MIFSYLLNMQSHPSWVCGLKLAECSEASEKARVTPFVGVWIETRLYRLHPEIYGSHPSWVCGLKLYNRPAWTIIVSSHPSWVCGLKHLQEWKDRILYVSHPSWVCGLKHHV